MLQCINIYEHAEREQLHEANGYCKARFSEDSSPTDVPEHVDSQTKLLHLVGWLI